MSYQSNVPPGWYPNQRDELQWWDGVAWGPQQPATTQHATEKPLTSQFVWISLGVSGLALILAIGLVWSFFLPTRFDYGYGQSSPGWSLLSLWFLVPLFGFAALSLAIIGTVKSKRKRGGILAIMVSILWLASPVLLPVAAFALYFIWGATSQLTGGPTLG